MSLQQLQYFRTVAELKHFTKAANKLMVSQPSLSHSISDLEAKLGVHLFERQGRKVCLTKCGTIYLEYVIEALDILEHGKAKLDDFIRPDAGTISLAYFSSLEGFISYLIPRFYTSTNQMKTIFQFQQLPNNPIEDNLISGSIDLAFATRLNNEKLRHHKVGEHNLVLIAPASHPLADKQSVDLRDLAYENFITYDYQCRIRYYIDQAFEIVGIKPKILSESTHDTIIYSYVAANYGLGLVPEPLGMWRHNIKTLQIENKLPPRDVYLCWRDVRYLSPAVKKMRDFIIQSGLILDEYRNNMQK